MNLSDALEKLKMDMPITASVVVAEIERLTAENDRLRADLAEFSRLKEYAKSLGQETYLELHADNERLRAALGEIAYHTEAPYDEESPAELREWMGSIQRIAVTAVQQQAVKE